MTQEQRITVRLSPKLKKQLTVLQKSLYQSQRYEQDKGKRDKVRMLSLSQVARIVLTNAFKKPGSRIKKAEDLTIEEKIESEMLKLAGFDFWNDDKLLDKNLADNEELEEIDYCLKKREELRRKSLKGIWTEKDEEELRQVDARIDKIKLRAEKEQAEAEKGRHRKRRRCK